VRGVLFIEPGDRLALVGYYVGILDSAPVVRMLWRVAVWCSGNALVVPHFSSPAIWSVIFLQVLHFQLTLCMQLDKVRPFERYVFHY